LLGDAKISRNGQERVLLAQVGLMRLSSRIRAFFKAIHRTARKLRFDARLEAARKKWEEEKRQRIQLSGNLLYVRFPRLVFQIASGLETGTVELSLAEARAFFASIRDACERRDIVHFRAGDLSWTTDARLRANKPDNIVVRLSGPAGRASTSASRERLLSAYEEFADMFGQTPTISAEVNADGLSHPG